MMKLFLGVFLILASQSHGITPAEAATRFVESLRDDKPKNEINSYCILNAETGDIKKEIIHSKWKEYGTSMLNVAFTLLEEKIDNDHAAVVLWQRMGKISKEYQIYSVVLIKDQGEWKPAPVLSSFENSLASFSPTVQETRKNLLKWIADREVSAQGEIETRIKVEFEAAMRQFVTPDQLKEMNATGMVQSFTQAIRQKNSAAAIAHLGGYSKVPTEKARYLHLHIARCLEDPAKLNGWPWNLLADPRTIQIPIEDEREEMENTFRMLALHRESMYSTPQILEFTVSKDQEGMSTLELPDYFTKEKVSEADEALVLDEEAKRPLKAFLNYIKKEKSLLSPNFNQSVEEYSKYLCRCLSDNDFRGFWIASVTENFWNDDGISDIPSTWQSLQKASGSSLFAFIAHKQEDEYATAVLRNFSPRDGLSVKFLWLKQVNQKWMLLDDEPEDLPESITKWIMENSKLWDKSSTADLLTNVQRINGLPNTELKAEEIGKAFDAWKKAVSANTLVATLPFCAAFDDEASRTRMLKNLGGYLAHDAGEITVLKTHTSGRWGAVSTKLDLAKPGSKPQFPLYIFVATDAGPKMLPQIDYRLAPGSISRDFLNKTVMRDLAKLVPEQAAEELQKIIEIHGELVAKQQLIPTSK